MGQLRLEVKEPGNQTKTQTDVIYEEDESAEETEEVEESPQDELTEQRSD